MHTYAASSYFVCFFLSIIIITIIVIIISFCIFISFLALYRVSPVTALRCK